MSILWLWWYIEFPASVNKASVMSDWGQVYPLSGLNGEDFFTPGQSNSANTTEIDGGNGAIILSRQDVYNYAEEDMGEDVLSSLPNYRLDVTIELPDGSIACVSVDTHKDTNDGRNVCLGLGQIAIQEVDLLRASDQSTIQKATKTFDPLAVQTEYHLSVRRLNGQFSVRVDGQLEPELSIVADWDSGFFGFLSETAPPEGGKVRFSDIKISVPTGLNATPLQNTPAT